MTRQEIIKGLNENGYFAEEFTGVKNSVEMEGIIVRLNNDASPILYMKDIADLSLEEIINILIGEYCDGVTKYINTIKNRDSILSAIYIGMQRKSGQQNYVKHVSELEGIEEYLYILFSRTSEMVRTCKVTKEILEYNNISLKTAWRYGDRNTKAGSQILNMGMALNLLGFDIPDDISKIKMYVITNSIMYYGASAILNKELLNKFGQDYGVNKVIAIPSSIHEFMLLPYYDEIIDSDFIDELNDTIRHVNKIAVTPEEILSDHAYILEV